MTKTICSAKKTTIAALTAAILCTGISPLALPRVAFAGQEDLIQTASVKDTYFHFRFKAKGDTFQGDTPRAKEDDSSVYTHVATITCDYCRAYVDGAKTKNGKYKNFTVDGKATMKSTGRFSISNLVKEKGRSYARLTGWAESKPGNVIGEWSPDSTRDYKLINGNCGIN